MGEGTELELTFTRLAGDGDRAELLVVGPSLGTSVTALWAPCAVLLGNRFEVVGWDLPGHGRSPAAGGPFTVEDLAGAVRTRTTELLEGRTAWYAGVSLGGAVGLALALDPGPFRAAAILASAPRIGEPEGWRDRADLVRRAGTPVMVSGSAERWFAPGFMAREPEVAGELLTSLQHTDRHSYAWACEGLARFDVVSRMAEVRIPVLLAPGEHDQVVTPAQAEAVAPTGGRVRVQVVSGAGHLPSAEQPETVAAMLDRFLVTDKEALP